MKKKDILIGLIISLFLAGFISWFASSSPDGLERVAEDKGFLEKGDVRQAVDSPIPDYAWPRIKNERLATSLAGIAGTLIVFGVGLGFAVFLKKKSA